MNGIYNNNGTPLIVPDFYYIANSRIHGSGVFSKNVYMPHQVIGKVLYRKLAAPIEFYGVTSFGKWINHSWTPSTYMKKIYTNGIPAWYICANTIIVPGTEFTVNYDQYPGVIKGANKNWL